MKRQSRKQNICKFFRFSFLLVFTHQEHNFSVTVPRSLFIFDFLFSYFFVFLFHFFFVNI